MSSVHPSALRFLSAAGQKPGSQQGITLIELMMTVLILGVLAAIAVPSYTQYMTNGRRSDAVAFLSEIAGEQQRYFSSFNQYASDLQELGYPTATMTSPEGHYQVSVSNPGNSTLRYELTATPVSGGKQAGDTECGAFVINSTGARTSTGVRKDCW